MRQERATQGRERGRLRPHAPQAQAVLAKKTFALRAQCGPVGPRSRQEVAPSALNDLNRFDFHFEDFREALDNSILNVAHFNFAPQEIIH